MRILLFIISTTFLFGCQKFEHTAFAFDSCELCSYASTLEGTYRGYAYDSWFGGDSATVTIEHIFLGESQMEDSVYMYFTATFIFDSLTPVHSFDIDTFRIKNSSGAVYGSTSPTDHWINFINSDSLIVKKFFWGGQSNGYISDNYGTLFHQ